MYIKKHAQISDSYKKIVIGFLALTAIILVVVLYFSLGKAVIRITSQTTPLATDFVADVATDGGAAEALPGVLFETEVEGEKIGEATGVKVLEGDSIGEVKLINKRAESQALVKTTRLLAPNGVLLRLTESVDIPAGGEIFAKVYADDPNSFTELAPTKFTIPGLWEGLQTQVYAETTAAMKSTGASVKQVKAVDISRTQDELNEELYAKAIEEFKHNLPQDRTIVVVAKKVLASSVDTEAEAQADNFVTKLKLSVTMIALDQNKIVELASGRLSQVVPDGQELLSLDLDKFSYKVQNFDTTNKTANIKVHVEGASVIRADHEIFNKEKLSGLSAKGVELYLSNFSEVESVKVELSPFWVKKVPRMEDHVIILIEQATGN